MDCEKYRKFHFHIDPTVNPEAAIANIPLWAKHKKAFLSTDSTHRREAYNEAGLQGRRTLLGFHCTSTPATLWLPLAHPNSIENPGLSWYPPNVTTDSMKCKTQTPL